MAGRVRKAVYFVTTVGGQTKALSLLTKSSIKARFYQTRADDCEVDFISHANLNSHNIPIAVGAVRGDDQYVLTWNRNCANTVMCQCTVDE